MEPNASPTAETEVTVERALQLALDAHRAARINDAERWYRAILQAQPRHPEANHNLGMVDIQLGRTADALPHLQVAVETSPDTVQFWLSYVGALIRIGRSEDAAEAIDRGLAYGLGPDATRVLRVLASKLAFGDAPPGPDSAELKSLLGKVRSGDFVAAAADAESLTRKFPAHGYAWKILGSVKLITGRLAEAVPTLTIAANLMPEDAEVHNNLGVALRRSGQFDAALASGLTAARLRPDFAEALNNVGLAFLDLGRPADAEEYLRRAVAAAPDYADAHNNLGRALYAQRRVFDAESCYRRAITISPDLADAHNNLGIVHFVLSENREAIISFKRALRIAPEFPDALNNLGMARRALGKFKDAESCISRALELRPDFVEAHNNLAAVLADLGRPEEARESCHRAIALRPDFGPAFGNLGNILYELDDLGGASAAYRRALELDPTDSGLDAGVSLAVLSYLAGDTVGCRTALRAVEAVRADKGPRRRTAQTYWSLLDRLLAHTAPGPVDGSLPVIHVIGDSHSLCAHGLKVRWRGAEMRCSAELVFGCKQWHFAQGRPNRFRRKFESVLARLPPGATILLAIGEGDCRPDAGIAKAIRKFPEKAMEQIVRETTAGYVAYLRGTAAQFGHRPIICGVPASNVAPGDIGEKETQALAETIRCFNLELKSGAHAAGMDFIDLFEMTAGAGGTANGRCHIDQQHLLPTAFVAAIEDYCRPPR